MISKKMRDALNKQINAELYSAYLYWAMASYSTVLGLKGAAKWFFVQGQEEMTHAARFYFYVNDVNEHAILDAIDKPQATFKNLQQMFEATLKHEKVVTSLINNLANLARQEKDHATEVFLQWFITEQVEEEANASEILAKLKLAGDNVGAMFMIDAELGARGFAMPPDLAPKLGGGGAA